MTLRPAPGPQIAAGRLRVDAAKAIAKLREYQLVYRPAWILEAIRAAVASGATAIDLQGDANDVWLSWTCTPWPVDDLPQLFDELVSPEPGASRHHMRLLAGAINSALGLNPAYVDVYTIADDGAMRVRYTAEVLEVPEGDFEDSPLRKLQAQAADAPPGAGKGMHVHLRRRASLAVLSHWVRRAEPPELAVAHATCADIATPIRVGDRTYDRAANPGDALRVPLGNDLEGFVAVLDTTRATPPEQIAFGIAERGVLLETSTIDLGLEVLAPAPLRVFVDGPRMPTNASRSEVRRSAHPLPAAERRAREVLPDVVAELGRRLTSAPPDPRARHAALWLLASQIAGYDWFARARQLGELVKPLGELLLVHDAAGVPRPVAWEWSGLVHTGREPLGRDLAAWLSHVLWAPPNDPTRGFAPWHRDTGELDLHVKLARRERRAEKKFYRHAQRAPRVEGRRRPRVRAKLGAPLERSCIADAVFDGFTGEVCVYRDGRGGGELQILYAGRDLEVVQFDSALSFAAVIDGARIRPTDRFRRVTRDAEYARLETAMRGGIVRAIEALVLARSGTHVHGYDVGGEPGVDRDRRIIRDGLLLSRNSRAPITRIFDDVAIWRTTEGDRSLGELRDHAVLGLVARHANVAPLVGRLVVHADETDRALLADLVSSHWIAYEPGQLAERLEGPELAMQVMGTIPNALAIPPAHCEGEVVAAIVPAEKPRLLLHHRGTRVAELAYTPALAPCTIAVDSDRIVPAPDWKGVTDDAGLAVRDYAPWERLLARAAASAICGRRFPELLGYESPHPGSTLGRWLCRALVAGDPREVLGDEVLATFRTHWLFEVLGDPRRYSIDELAVMFPQTINFVEASATAVPGYPVLVAGELVARMIAKIAGREAFDAAAELANQRARLARELRIADHRARPTCPLDPPYGGRSFAFRTALGAGRVGVGRDTLELTVLVEGRKFQTITRPGDLPIAVVFDVGLDHIDAPFEQVKPEVVDQICAAAGLAAIDLVTELANEEPLTLGEAGPRRTLLARLAAGGLAPHVRDVVREKLELPTIQGGHARVAQARMGPSSKFILTSTWHGDWIPASEADASDLDQPILSTGGSPEIATIVGALGAITDVTNDVARLQTQRRIARGLLPAPKVTAGVPELTRRLGDLGADYRHLGPGEVALVGGASEVLIHVHGELRERVPITCRPAIQLAIEAADLVGHPELVEHRLGKDARELALKLAREIISGRRVEALPTAIRHSLRAGVLAGVLADLRALPVFETMDGRWIDLAAVQAQRELFGKLWSVPRGENEAGAAPAPLDERRIVLVLDAMQVQLANEHGIPVIDAREELALDGLARANRARPLATSLAIPDEPFVLAKVELQGDGLGAPRGTVGVLDPSASNVRGLRLHRGMHPFGAAPDPCRWPTLALVDDARLVPDRTWSQPERDDICKQAIEAVHRASNEALRNLVPPPANALAAVRLAPWSYDQIAALRTGDIQIRGTLWIAGPPVAASATAIRVVEMAGERSFVPLRGPGLAGTIYVFAPSGWTREEILEDLSKLIHGKLVREIAMVGRRDPDLVAAHVAWALALERIKPEDAKHVRFACFRPEPLDAGQLVAAVLAPTTPVAIVPPGSKYDELALVDDGSETARVLKVWLGARLRAPSARARRETVEPPPPIDKPIVEHPLQFFVDALHARIGELGIAVRAWRIVDGREEPIVAHAAGDDVLEIAANNRRLVAIAAAVAAKTAWSYDMLDALAAHCVTVLNVALTSITDASEGNAIARLLA